MEIKEMDLKDSMSKEENLNILYIHRTQGKGVEAVHISGIANAFKELNHNVFFADPVDDPGNHVESKPSLFLKFIVWACKYLPEAIFEMGECVFNIIQLKKLYPIIKKNKIDFIYERYAFCGLAGVILSKMFKVPLFLEVNFLTSTPMARKRSWFMLPFVKHFEKKILLSCASVLYITNFVKEECIKHGVPENKMVYTPNGIDINRVKIHIHPEELRKKLHINEDDTVIGFVGGFYFWQGLEMLVDKAAIICAKTKAVKFLLVGNGPEYNKIVQRVKEYQLMDNFIFTGNINHKDIWSYINIFDIAVLPDTNEYASPVKLFEYMAMHTAILAPDVGPVKEIFNHGQNAILFKKEDRADFRTKLEKLINDNELVVNLAENANKHVYRNFTYQSNVKSILDFFNNKLIFKEKKVA